MKKIFALVLALVLLMAALPAASVSADVGDQTFYESESNNSFGSANIIRNDYTIRAAVSTYDMDYYVFSVSKTSTFLMSCVADYSWLMCGLYNYSQTILLTASQSWTDSGNPADSIITTLQPGTYYLLFLNAEDSSLTNDYTFYISLTPTGSSHTHYYYPLVTYPSCTEGGYTTYSCSCGDSYVSDYTSKTGHSMSSWTTTPATCTKDGEKYRYCYNCNYTEKETISKTGHTMSSWTTIPATCIETGEKYRYCYDCDYVESQTISKTGHAYKSYVTAPTCTEEGYTTHSCTYCGDSYVDSYTAKIGHSMGDWHTIPSTCTVKGQKYRFCDVCGFEENIALSLIAHTYTDNCDAYCNVCFGERVPPHTYTDNCEVVCHDCGYEREAPHTFTDLHDTICNDCGFERVIPDVTPGDVNGDSRINNRDLGLMQQYLNDWDVDRDMVFAMDVNDDGRANNRDLGLLQQHLNDWDVELK